MNGRRKVVIDCGAGRGNAVQELQDVKVEPLTPTELVEVETREAEFAVTEQKRAAVEAQLATDLAMVRAEAAKDPKFAALARAAGLIGPEEGMK